MFGDEIAARAELNLAPHLAQVSYDALLLHEHLRGTRDMARGHVAGVAGLVGLLAAGVAGGDLPAERVAPVRTLARIAG